LGLGLTSVALVSGTAAAWLANSFASKPLMQSQLTQNQAGVVDGTSLSGTGLSFAQLTHPVNILVLATTSLPEDIDFGKHRPSQSETLKYAHSFDGSQTPYSCCDLTRTPRKWSCCPFPEIPARRLQGMECEN
jgi:hypothetical protein